MEYRIGNMKLYREIPLSYKLISGHIKRY